MIQNINRERYAGGRASAPLWPPTYDALMGYPGRGRRKPAVRLTDRLARSDSGVDSRESAASVRRYDRLCNGWILSKSVVSDSRIQG